MFRLSNALLKFLCYVCFVGGIYTGAILLL